MMKTTHAEHCDLGTHYYVEPAMLADLVNKDVSDCLNS